jgi:hypothetical protein
VASVRPPPAPVPSARDLILAALDRNPQAAVIFRAGDGARVLPDMSDNRIVSRHFPDLFRYVAALAARRSENVRGIGYYRTDNQE